MHLHQMRSVFSKLHCFFCLFVAFLHCCISKQFEKNTILFTYSGFVTSTVVVVGVCVWVCIIYDVWAKHQFSKCILYANKFVEFAAVCSSSISGFFSDYYLKLLRMFVFYSINVDIFMLQLWVGRGHDEFLRVYCGLFWW